MSWADTGESHLPEAVAARVVGGDFAAAVEKTPRYHGPCWYRPLGPGTGRNAGGATCMQQTHHAALRAENGLQWMFSVETLLQK